MEKCFEISHFPLNCNLDKEWKRNKFERVITKYKNNANLIDCPFCKKSSFKFLKTTNNGNNNDPFPFKKKCYICSKLFCLICLQKWNPKSYLLNQNYDHHCKENSSKGFNKKIAEEALDDFQKFNENYPRYLKEKNHLEETLKKMTDYFENYEFKNELEEEVCNFFGLCIGFNKFFLKISLFFRYKKLHVFREKFHTFSFK